MNQMWLEDPSLRQARAECLGVNRQEVARERGTGPDLTPRLAWVEVRGTAEVMRF